MFINIGYNRESAVNYAEEWAFSRNKRYMNFDDMGGDCTNFVSQCIFAGCNTMNYSPTFGWYYRTINKRAAAWSGVQYLYNFLTNNYDPGNSSYGAGPYGIDIFSTMRPVSAANSISMTAQAIKPGDLIQLGDVSGRFYHSLLVVEAKFPEIYVATHTFDAYMRPLSSYSYDNIRYVHIVDCRKSV